ncbi:GNAT family N-acetyltransferase [Galbitalea sp. SE-J8]|uniref:GNAT family N-acetyltransferase n=1 Tax=Galbitalea sp. SE-J8 TaxID=3054952 RepID=UPI00259C9EF2|nr:GNAT family N-acetyltransferase [Galbitalea sp. SE-J8]MDM4762076.1 GNAT family N-acetyltransferase [Galbitalea sp. SE-J8]
MAFELAVPSVEQLDGIIDTLAGWQRDDAPIQLHPGDLGWHARLGAAATAAAVRVWRQDGRLVAIGLLDGPEVLRLTLAPAHWDADGIAARIVADVSDPLAGVFPAGTASVEAPDGTRVRDLLDAAGWEAADSWSPLRRDLSVPVPPPGLRIEIVGPDDVPAFTAVHRSAWDSTRFTDVVWREMAAGHAFASARGLLALDDAGTAVAGVIVWSAGAGRPGLLEPMGVHAGHRRHGYGTSVCRAAAAELQRMGASSAMVCTESVRTSAIATYRAAGYEPLPERRDRTRRE